MIMGEVVTRERLLQLVQDDRREGRTIAFANGCFDLVHVGHVRYLQAAAAEADRLIVAESGISTAQDLADLARYGARAFLVGESLMREDDVAGATRRLLARPMSAAGGL